MKRRLTIFLLIIDFVAMNAVAFFHAWRFTHFSNEPGVHSPNPEQLGPGRKIWVLLTGIRNPKPQNGHGPHAHALEDNLTLANLTSRLPLP